MGYEWPFAFALFMCLGLIELARRYRDQRDTARDERDQWERQVAEYREQLRMRLIALKVGDRVTCHEPGSWVDGKAGTIKQLNVWGSDNIKGHVVVVDGTNGYTVLPPLALVLVPPEDQPSACAAVIDMGGG